MRIGIEAQHLFSSNKTVVEHIMCDVLRVLQQQDKHQYVVFVREGEDICLRPTSHMRIVVLKATNRAHFEQIVLPRAVLREEVQLLHCTTNSAPLFCQVPILLSLHDTSVLLRHQKDETWSRRYRNLVLSRLMHAPIHITADSTMEREQLLHRFQLDESHVHTMHPAIAAGCRPISDIMHLRAIKERYGLPDRYVLVMGGTDPAKGVAQAIRGYLRYMDTTTDPRPMVMPHAPRSWVQEQLRELERENDLSWFYFPERIMPADLPAIYNMAGVFLCAAVREGFCLSVVEAMACGTPVVAAETAGSPEIADGAILTVPAEEAGEMATALKRVLEDYALSESLSHKGLDRAAYFSAGESAIRWQTLYEQCVEGSATS